MMLLEEVIFKEAHCLLQNARNLAPELNELVDLMVEEVKADRPIILAGAGKCYTICIKMVETMRSLGIPSLDLCCYTSGHGDLGVITKNSLMITFSKSGATRETVNCIRGAGEKGAKLVSITCTSDSKTGAISKQYGGLDIVLTCPEEACAMKLAPTSSTTLFCVIGDALAITASERLGMTKEKFLINHADGSLGEKIKAELNG